MERNRRELALWQGRIWLQAGHDFVFPISQYVSGSALIIVSANRAHANAFLAIIGIAIAIGIGIEIDKGWDEATKVGLVSDYRQFGGLALRKGSSAIWVPIPIAMDPNSNIRARTMACFPRS